MRDLNRISNLVLIIILLLIFVRVRPGSRVINVDQRLLPRHGVHDVDGLDGLGHLHVDPAGPVDDAVDGVLHLCLPVGDLELLEDPVRPEHGRPRLLEPIVLLRQELLRVRLHLEEEVLELHERGGVQGRRLPGRVPHLLEDTRRLFRGRDGLRGLFLHRVDLRLCVQHLGLPLPLLAEVPVDAQGILRRLHRLLDLPPLDVHLGDGVQRVRD
mmetsp:Transcript_34061/g.95797  ORF Transcript_34061/g.95797 Transcript_34061/m.95797 type:complete len:213 (-) Transcript_34061:950-1588(-)